MSADIVKLLAQGKNFLWALRHCQQQNLTPDDITTIRTSLAEDGIDLGSLMALRQLEYPIARFSHPTVNKAVFDDFYFFPIPAFDIEIFFKTMICEHGMEQGIELLPGKVDWTFGHDEIQYCIGGGNPV